jgi:pimeloyl-ACP methyl ester carboxylesterase
MERHGPRKGDREGRALVLLHGAGGDRGLWAEVQRVLTGEGVPTAPLDLAGHGARAGQVPSAVEVFADAVEQSLREAGIERYAVAGHSLGGAVALTLAVRKAEGLRGVGLVSTGARLPVDPRILQGLRVDFSRTVENLSKHLFARGTDREAIRRAEQMMESAGPDRLYPDFYACSVYEVSSRELRGLGVPVEVVCGEDDVLTPVASSVELAEAIPGASLTRLRNVGHMPLLEAPADLALALARLWRRSFGEEGGSLGRGGDHLRE